MTGNDGINSTNEQIESLEIELGDFVERTFPKTYNYFKKNNFEKLYYEKCGNFDCFDYFIREKVHRCTTFWTSNFCHLPSSY